MKKRYLILLLFATFYLFTADNTFAQDSHSHNHDEPGNHTGLHFVHPLFTESISPDTKLRLDYQFQYPGTASESELEGEYAFSRIFSIEAGVHYDPVETSLGNTHLLFKFANYALEEKGILLGYGLSLDLPTGNGHGHGTGVSHEQEPGDHHHEENIYRVSPFLNAGLKAGSLELVGWALFNIPTNHAHPEDASTSLSYNISALYHLSTRIQSLVELNGIQRLSGVVSGNNLFLSPGVRIRLLKSTPLLIGLGMQVPVTENQNTDTRIQASVFYHF